MSSSDRLVRFQLGDDLRVCISPPPVVVSTNDSLVVHATNSLDQATTLHHHGMFFNATPWMDGALGVSEW